jgi:hypothetical protein
MANLFLNLTDRVCWSKNASKCECLRITLVECLTQENGTSILKIDAGSRELAHHKRRENIGIGIIRSHQTRMGLDRLKI